MSDNELKKKSGEKGTAPLARLTGGGGGEMRVIERVVWESETSSSTMVLTHTNYMEWALLMQVNCKSRVYGPR